ncbi:Transcription initiation protein spt3 [Fusarium poae]|uniref:hypothetical protein n=1 Tax=Fusarium poae TaxID=36050 RepID=UPI001CE9D08B|nr:hypothetical protein FPOAC1_005338 [Fusarium poae]KAG8672077.1 hypothetical protein FPOAC1_005338 [Fusarium poae]
MINKEVPTAVNHIPEYVHHGPQSNLFIDYLYKAAGTARVSALAKNVTSSEDATTCIMATFLCRYSNEIQQMMYVAGETQDVSVETLTMVEQIVHEQIRHLLSIANEIAGRRRKRTIDIDDIIFQIRHDTNRVARIQRLLRWRAIRRDAKKTNRDAGGDGDADVDMDDEDFSEDPLESPPTEEAAGKKTEPAAGILPWDMEYFYSIVPPGGETNETLLNKAGDVSLESLRWADEITKNMSKQEYDRWAMYRKASFTTRKTKRFQQWAGIGVIARVVKKSDTLEIIGFLAVEMVKRLTDIALTIQAQDLAAFKRRNGQCAAAVGSRRHGLFVPVDTDRPPINVEHIRRAFDETQMKPKKKRVRLNRTAGTRTLVLI